MNNKQHLVASKYTIGNVTSIQVYNLNTKVMLDAYKLHNDLNYINKNNYKNIIEGTWYETIIFDQETTKSMHELLQHLSVLEGITYVPKVSN